MRSFFRLATKALRVDSPRGELRATSSCKSKEESSFKADAWITIVQLYNFCIAASSYNSSLPCSCQAPVCQLARAEAGKLRPFGACGSIIRGRMTVFKCSGSPFRFCRPRETSCARKFDAKSAVLRAVPDRRRCIKGFCTRV